MLGEVVNWVDGIIRVMKVGRPTKYDPSFINEVDNYIATTGSGTMHMPKIESLAIRLNVSKNTLYEWAKEHKEFQDALAKLMNYQGERLIDDGIYGGKEVNATIVKLLLQNNHGMKERSDVTTNDKDLPTPLLNALHNNDSNEETGQTKEEN
jgi:hypothetical protein